MREVDRSYAWCRSLCRRSKSSFFASFAILDEPRRKAMYALYAFARISDDLSDGLSPARASITQTDLMAEPELLAAWRCELQRQLGIQVAEARPEAAAEYPRILKERYAGLWPALQHMVEAFQLPTHLLIEIVDGVMMDLDHHEPEDWKELERYCYHVASAVGLACTHLWRAPQASIPTQAAIHCGLAFQFTNILRDVWEDARRDRIYLPCSLLDEYRVDRQSWLEGRPTGQWEAMLDEVGRRAAHYYALGWPTIEALTPRSQRMFSLMWRSYHALLNEVLRNKSSLWTGQRIRVGNRHKLRLLTQHYWSPLYRRLPTPCPQ